MHSYINMVLNLLKGTGDEKRREGKERNGKMFCNMKDSNSLACKRKHGGCVSWFTSRSFRPLETSDIWLKTFSGRGASGDLMRY